MKPWTYKGVTILPAGRNGSGIRWTASAGLGFWLKADTKAGMRQLVTEALQK